MIQQLEEVGWTVGGVPGDTSCADNNVQTAMTQGVSKAELINELQRLDDELGSAPTMGQMNEQGDYSAMVYRKKFGSWNKALREAGIAERRSGRQTSRGELIDELQRLADELGHTPTSEEMDEYGEYTSQTYQRYFDSWIDAVNAAGV